VLVKFERRNAIIRIHHADDGIGLPANHHYGNGLTNTGNRIKMPGSRLIFDKTATKGLKILISLSTV